VTEIWLKTAQYFFGWLCPVMLPAFFHFDRHFNPNDAIHWIKLSMRRRIFNTASLQGMRRL
jgi:hypothetical protein